MRMQLLAAAAIATASLATVAYADDDEMKKTGLVGGAVTGAVVGGPVGAVVGGAVGATTGAAIDQSNKPDTVIIKERKPDVVIQEDDPDVIIDNR